MPHTYSIKGHLFKENDVIVFHKDCFFYDEQYKEGQLHLMRACDVGHNFEAYASLLRFAF